MHRKLKYRRPTSQSLRISYLTTAMLFCKDRKMSGRFTWLAVCCLSSLSYLGVSAVTTTEGITVPIPSQPDVCSALQQLSSSSGSFCTTTDSCQRLRCTIPNLNLGSMDIGVLPCDDPPAVLIVLSQGGNEVYHNTFTHSQVFPVSYSGLTLSINVTVIQSQNQDSITVGVVVTPALPLPGFPSVPITIIPLTSIPIDRSQCGSVATSSGYTSSPSTTDSPPHPQTCQALQRIASTSVDQCRPVEQCTALDCDFFGIFHSRVALLPCNNPPAIHLTIHDSSGSTIVNETVTNSRVQPIILGGTHLFDLVVNITHIPNSIILRVYIRSSQFGNTELIPNTTIPIDRSGCSSLPPSNNTASPPTLAPTEPTSKTCQALQRIESSATGVCSTSDSCTYVLCRILDRQMNLTVIPCDSPPAIGLKVEEVNGNVLIDDVLTRSRVENVTISNITLLRLNVTIKHSPNTIILKIPKVLPIIPETSIPIDQSDCPGITSPNTARVGNSSHLAKIVAPVTVVAVLLVAVLVILVIVGVVYGSRKRARAFTFQRMAFNSVNDQDEDEDEDS